MREGLRLSETLPDAVMRVPYEKMVAEPQSVLGAIENFCGLRSDPGFRNYGAEVLAPPDARPQPELHETIRPTFQNIQRILGYVE